MPDPFKMGSYPSFVPFDWWSLYGEQPQQQPQQPPIPYAPYPNQAPLRPNSTPLQNIPSERQPDLFNGSVDANMDRFEINTDVPNATAPSGILHKYRETRNKPISPLALGGLNAAANLFSGIHSDKRNRESEIQNNFLSQQADMFSPNKRMLYGDKTMFAAGGGQVPQLYPAPSLKFQNTVQEFIKTPPPAFTKPKPVLVSQKDNTNSNATANAKKQLESYTPEEIQYFTTNKISKDKWHSEKVRLEEQAILKARQDAKRQSIEDVKNNPFAITKATNENLKNEFRAFPNDPNSFFDEYLNPAVMLGTMAGNLGSHFASDRTEPINPWELATDFMAPLFAGATASIGAKNTGQFVNNAINPFAGMNVLPKAGKTANAFTPGVDDAVTNVINKKSWQMKEMPGLHLKSTMEGEAISKIVEPKTGLINTEQALAIIGKESGGAEKASLIRQGLGDNIPQKMDYNDFRKVVQDQLIPLERQFSTHASNYGVGKLGYPSPKRSSYEAAIEHANIEREKVLQILKEYEGYIKNPNKYKKAFSYDSNLSKTNDELLPQIKSTLDDYKQRLVDTEHQISNSMEEMKLLPLENQTLILGNKNKFGAGSSAHSNPDETLGHIHFLRDAETPDVLTVTQIQSDAFQGTHKIMPKNAPDAVALERQQKSLQRMEEIQERNKSVLNKMKTEGVDEAGLPVQDYQIKQFEDIVKAQEQTNLFKKAHIENFTQKQLLDKNHQERYLQELVDYAGKRGDINKVRVPTAETAAKVQGYRKEVNPLYPEAKTKILNLEVEIKKHDDFFKDNFDHPKYKEKANKLASELEAAKKQEINSKEGYYSSEHQTILKKYSEQPKTIKKLFGVEPKVVTDSKGNSWYEFDIPKKFKERKGEIKAFSLVPVGGLGYLGTNESEEQPIKYANGGPVKPTWPIPTSSDSTNLYNNAVKLNDYYNNSSLYEKSDEKEKSTYKLEDYLTPVKKDSYGSSKIIDLSIKRNLHFYDLLGYETYSKTHKKWLEANNIRSQEDFDKLISGVKNTYEKFRGQPYKGILYDLISPRIDFAAPPMEFDTRIPPDYFTSYISKQSESTSPGGSVYLPMYNTKNIKPWNLLTSQEKQDRILQFKEKNTDSKNKDLPVEGKQQELVKEFTPNTGPKVFTAIPSPVNPNYKETPRSTGIPFLYETPAAPAAKTPTPQGNLPTRWYAYQGPGKILMDNKYYTEAEFDQEYNSTKDKYKYSGKPNSVGQTYKTGEGVKKYKKGGEINYELGGEYELTKKEIEALKKQGYEFE